MALERERQYFESIKEDLLRHHEGKFALVIGTELLGVFDHREQAYQVGIERHGNVPMLIKQILEAAGVLEDDSPARQAGLGRRPSVVSAPAGR